MVQVLLDKVISPGFYDLHQELKGNKYNHIWVRGGRGSTKSTFIAAEILLGIISDPKANAMVFRKVAADLRESVYGQFLWTIDKMQLTPYFKEMTSPMQIIYLPTGQRIIFKGLDKASKRKSTKLGKGYIKYIWYEELDEFAGTEEIRNVNQSLMRGGDSVAFYSYNPPKTSRSWVNVEAKSIRPDRYVHTSDYTTVPKEWLGPVFISEAKDLAEKNPTAYNHEYLGEETGTGGEIFKNITIREISKEERESFCNIRQGLDWGFAVDPYCFGRMNYDRMRRKLFIFYEHHGIGISNRAAADRIKEMGYNDCIIIADSAEPKSIAEMKDLGIARIRGAKKGPGSVEHGIKWLADLEEIIIDPCCTLAAREFETYCLDKDRNGEWISRYPDKDNHSIDETRYALELDMKSNKPGWS